MPATYIFTAQNAGTDTTVDSDADTATGISAVVTLTSGQNNPTIDAGVYQLASLGDTVWVDNNGNGVQDAGEPGKGGVVVNLLDGAGNPVLDGSGNAITTTTNTSGYYEFINLLPGTYAVQFELPATYIFTTQNAGVNDAIDSDPNTVTGITQTVTIISGENNPTVDAGIVLPASIGNYVWDDVDGNGIQDAGETGLNNVVVISYDAAGNEIVRDTTDASGNYSFIDLLPGTYTIEVVPPSGYTVSNPNQGTDSTTDSNISTTTNTSNSIVLVQGQNDSTIDAGLHIATLPVRLVTFNAAPQGNQVNVTWKVANEINVNRYEVFFSKDGRNFSSMGTVNAANRGNYNLLHMNPVNGLNYYRLKVIDNNGRVEFSEIKVVNFGTISSVTVYPNPAVNTINVTVSNDMINKAASINIFAADGKLMYQRKVAALNQTESIEVRTFAKGKYTLQIISGTNVINKPFLVIR